MGLIPKRAETSLELAQLIMIALRLKPYGPDARAVEALIRGYVVRKFNDAENRAQELPYSTHVSEHLRLLLKEIAGPL